MLKDLIIQQFYSSKDCCLLNEFYIPILSNSKNYYKATGFFSASLINNAFEGLAHFYENGGKIKFILGYVCSNDDLFEINKGLELQKEFQESLQRELSETFSFIKSKKDSYLAKKISLFSYLLSIDVIEIKVAVRKKGLYHEKISIYEDEIGDKISTIGSTNETNSAFDQDINHESFDAFKSWEPSELERIKNHFKNFDSLWNGEGGSTYIFNLPEAIKDNLVFVSEGISRLTVQEEDERVNNLLTAIQNRLSGYSGNLLEIDRKPKIPKTYNNNEFKLREHQKLALESWMTSEYSSILQLCTGSGKTIASIYGIVKLFDYFFKTEKKNNIFCLIVVPYINLADQWCEELNKFNIQPIKCYSGQGPWDLPLQGAINEHCLSSSPDVIFNCAVAVLPTFRSSLFQTFIKNIKSEFIFVADEVHNFENFEDALPLNANYRLGLSATIQGCENIQKYFSNETFIYSIENAIRDGILCEYVYNPILVYLTKEETENYSALTDKISQLQAMRSNNPKFDTKSLDHFIRLRGNLLGNASNKLIKLKEVVSQNTSSFKNSLFYCSSTMLDEEDIENDLRQIDNVVGILDNLALKTSKYTSQTRADNKNNLKEFKNGGRDCLVAIKCLDEGVDIPDVRVAFLISSTSNPKQFIQRRGRVLRVSEGKEFSTIYDFIIAIDKNKDEADKYSKRLMQSELKRIIDFYKTARNKDYLLEKIKNLCGKYEIDFSAL